MVTQSEGPEEGRRAYDADKNAVDLQDSPLDLSGAPFAAAGRNHPRR
jgi:hypothetical protein